MDMPDRDIRVTLTAFLAQGKAEAARLSQSSRHRLVTRNGVDGCRSPAVLVAPAAKTRQTRAGITPSGYLLASEAEAKYAVTRYRLRAWVRLGQVRITRGRNAANLPVYCYNEADIVQARRVNPTGRIVIWDPEPTTGLAISPRPARRWNQNDDPPPARRRQVSG